MKKILVLVTGMSPQVVTETLFGLAVAPEAGQRWVPDEIHLISTTTGLEQARLRLLDEGYFQALCDEYGLPPIRFDQSCLFAIRNTDDQAMDDLKTPAENEYAANTICEHIRQLTADEHCQLHVSIAGGRKTMGFYAGYALSLYGRAQDHLSHVLVSERYESLPDFFYPNRQTRVISDRDKKLSLDTSKAQVWLADIPFVRLRRHLPESTLLHKASFSQVVERIALATGDVRVVIDLSQHKLFVNGLECRLAPREFAFYLWLARRKLAGKGPVMTPVEGNPEKELGEEYLQAYRLVRGELHSMEDSMAAGMAKEFFEQVKSRLKSDLIKVLGEPVTQLINVKLIGRGKGFSLPLSLDQITIQ